MIRLRALICLLSISLAVWPASSFATAKDKLQKVETQLDEQKHRAEALDQQAQQAASTLRDLRQNLITATAAFQAKAEEADRLEDKLDDLEQDIDTKTKALANERQKLGMLTSTLIELSRRPPETLFLQTNLTTDHIHRAILVRAMMPRLREETEFLARDLVTLNDLKTQMSEQQHLVEAAQANLHSQQHELDQLIRVRQGLLQRTEAQKAVIAAQLVSLSSEAKDLRQLLDKVTPKHAPKSGPPSPHGTMKWPVAGNIIRKFGDRDVDGVTSQGLTFAGLPSSPVVAPLAGRVVFMGPFRGYGQILILQHQGGYHSFLAGFGRIDTEMGQDVEAGEPLGVLPAKTGSRPELYFEWRRNNEPVDPTSQGIALSKNP